MENNFIRESRDGRFRCFATLLYPESASSDWREKLSESHIEALVSPLHDRDLDSHGNLKKPHYHVLIYLPGKKSVEWANKFFWSLGGVGCEIVNSKAGMTRYLCHLDNPEKAQYAPTDVRAFGGANFLDWSEKRDDPMLFVPEIMDFIERHDVYSFYELCMYCKEYNPEWHRLLVTKASIYFREYLKSRKWKNSRNNAIYDLIETWKYDEDGRASIKNI